ncbi:mucin-3A-like isoform X1 [Pomacea canaliculata]|uniref:mucin-3A-like isoform X1 n=1 Tax=Pomacea canaliculata TaxID=400727 RepID=UPI000D73891B|nr:mucin-3A-like isoform X1 [Pomacea canaliculata]
MFLQKLSENGHCRAEKNFLRQGQQSFHLRWIPHKLRLLKRATLINIRRSRHKQTPGICLSVSGFTQISGSTMSSLPLSSEYSLTTEGESRITSTTDSHQNKPHIIASFSPVLIVSSMPFVESSIDHPKGSVSFQDNTKGSYSGESSASVSLTPELPSSTEGSKRRSYTVYPENLTSKSSLRTELGSTLPSKTEREGYFTSLETVTSSPNVQEVLLPSAQTNKVYLHTSNTFILKETEVASRAKTEVIASVKPTMTTSPLHETERTHFRSLTGLSTLNTRSIPTIDTVFASSELKTDGFMFTRSLKTDDVSIHSHQSVTTGNPHIYSNTVLSSTYDRNISVSPDTRTSRSSSLDFTQTTAQNQAGFSHQKTTTILSTQVELYSTFGQDVSEVTKLPTRFSTHELYRTTIDVQTSSEAAMYNTLNSLPEVRTTIPQIDVQTHRGTSVDTKPAKNNTVDKPPHNILGTTSTTDPIPTSHDQLAHLSLIIGVIAAALGVVVLGSLYILSCKHHRDSVTFSDDESAKEFIYCNIAYETGVNDENKKVRDAPSGIDKNEAPLTLKAFRRLSLSKTCVLREEIESPYNMVSTDANSLGKVSTASVSMETDSVSINSSEADYMDIDCPDDVTQQKENQKDFYFPYSGRKSSKFNTITHKKIIDLETVIRQNVVTGR